MLLTALSSFPAFTLGALVLFVGLLGTLAATAGAGLVSGGLQRLLSKGGGSDRNPTGRPTRQRILDQLRGETEGSLTDSSFFRGSAAALQGQADRQADRDRASRVQRGADSSEMAIAQNAQRQRTTAEGLQTAVRGAGRQRHRQLGQMLTAAGQQDANYWREREEKLQRRQQILNALGGALQTAGQAYGASQYSG